jgi:hypothetical protein
MTPQQKRILLILGGVDVLVVLLLGGIVLYSMRAPPAPPVPIPTVAPCARRLLDAYPAHAHPQVSWTPEVLRIDLVFLSTPPNTPTNSDGTIQQQGAQYLWEMLDILVPHLDAACPTPQVVILTVTTGEESGAPARHVVEFQGEDIAAWARGTLREDALAAQARYRGPAP